jgi:hypothetical protein
MSKELIERLRADAESTDDIGLCADAADRIEQLEAERDELTACLNLIYSWSNNWDSEFMNDPDWINTDYPRIQAAIAKASKPT